MISEKEINAIVKKYQTIKVNRELAKKEFANVNAEIEKLGVTPKELKVVIAEKKSDLVKKEASLQKLYDEIKTELDKNV